MHCLIGCPACPGGPVLTRLARCSLRMQVAGKLGRQDKLPGSLWKPWVPQGHHLPQRLALQSSGPVPSLSPAHTSLQTVLSKAQWPSQTPPVGLGLEALLNSLRLSAPFISTFISTCFNSSFYPPPNLGCSQSSALSRSLLSWAKRSLGIAQSSSSSQATSPGAPVPSPAPTLPEGALPPTLPSARSLPTLPGPGEAPHLLPALNHCTFPKGPPRTQKPSALSEFPKSKFSYDIFNGFPVTLRTKFKPYRWYLKLFPIWLQLS